MAQLTPTFALTSTDTGSDAISLSVTAKSEAGGGTAVAPNDYLTVTSPSANISRVFTNSNPLGKGAGILIEDTVAAIAFVYIRHTGLEAADGTTPCAADDYFDITDADGTTTGIQMRLYPGEFAFFPLTNGDGASSQGGNNDGGIKVAKNGSGSEVVLEFGYWTRS